MKIKKHLKKLNYICLALLVVAPILMGADNASSGGCVAADTKIVEVTRKRGLNFDFKINDLREGSAFAILENRPALIARFSSRDDDFSKEFTCENARASLFSSIIGETPHEKAVFKSLGGTDTMTQNMTFKKEIDFKGHESFFGTKIPAYNEPDEDQLRFYYSYATCTNPSECTPSYLAGADAVYIECKPILGLPILEKPTGLVANLSGVSADLNWTDNSSAITGTPTDGKNTDSVNEDGFVVERSTDNATFVKMGTTSADITTFSETISADTTYYYRVAAFDKYGNSKYSDTVTIGGGLSLAPTAPTVLGAVASSSSQIDLTWTDNATNETGYKVERGTDGLSFTEVIGNLPADSTSYSSTGLTASTQYYYRVRAYNTSGNSAYTNVANATTSAGAPPPPPTPPAAPSSLVGFPDPMTPPNIMLTWADNSSDETGFEVERSTTGGGVGFSNITTTSAGANSYSDTTSLAGTTYYYRVRAVNLAGDSAYSSEASVVNP